MKCLFGLKTTAQWRCTGSLLSSTTLIRIPASCWSAVGLRAPLSPGVTCKVALFTCGRKKAAAEIKFREVAEAYDKVCEFLRQKK